MNRFNQKKIGIWGFGVVGKSALIFLDQFNLAQIEVLNNNPINIPKTNNIVITHLQGAVTIKSFFKNNDYILVSPGIPLHDYQAYQDKFINELDLFFQYNTHPVIAITGSLGKTSITHLITTILQKNNEQAIAAGNIGYPMLSLVTAGHKNIDCIVLEVSSFQLYQSHNFAPDLAIITNVYDNHLDHHKNAQEYFDAKCNIFRQQGDNQIALLPCDLLPQIAANFQIKKNWIFFSASKPTNKILKTLGDNIIYYLDEKIIHKIDARAAAPVFDISQLPPITFDTNWLIIISALDLLKISLSSLPEIVTQLDIPEHRLQKIASLHGSDFYNDSKSTVWQATLQAVNCMDNKPIKLFLGGLSKGADRNLLLEALRNKNIEIYTFGQEADLLSEMCKNLQMAHQTHATLQESFDMCVQSILEPSNILFSPAGSSYDLFDNYIQRGQCFAQLVQNYLIKNPSHK